MTKVCSTANGKERLSRDQLFTVALASCVRSAAKYTWKVQGDRRKEFCNSIKRGKKPQRYIQVGMRTTRTGNCWREKKK